MAFKMFVIFAFFGIASAYVAPLTLISGDQLAALRVAQVQEDPLPQYTYSYGVHDSISGDSKTQTETRNGDNVKGEYSLNDADGYKRTVIYTADSANGFQAVVDRKPIADVAADIQASIAAQSVVPNAAPLVIKDLSAFNRTVLPIIQPSTPLVYSSPGLFNSAPLAYSAPLVAQSTSIAAPLAFNAPLALVAHSGPLTTPLDLNAPLIINSAPIAYPASGTYITRSVFKPIESVTYSAIPAHPITYPAQYLISN